jgi:hypothetical protein
MGNRAVITTQDKDLGIYLHWNGGRNSVEGFLLYCKMKGYRAPENDCYGWARLCQVIGNFFGGEYSVGIDRYDRLDTDNGDNGVYIIKDWQIIGKEFEPLDTLDIVQVKMMLESINSSMPTSEQLDINELYKAADALASSQPITTKQIKAIHTVVNKLGWDESYKQFLQITFGVDTCKKLNTKQASALIDILNKLEEQ